MKENIKALDEVHKGCIMGKDGIDYIIDKVKDNNLKKELEKEYKEYDDIANTIDEIYPNYNDGNPKNTSMMTKAMTWTGVGIETLLDKTNSKIAEIMIQGLDKGIIDGRKILNKKKLNEEVNKIVSKYVLIQEEAIENLKKYL